MEGERGTPQRPQARGDEGGMVKTPPRAGRASQGRPGVPNSPPRGRGGEAGSNRTEGSSVMARERYGNGYKGRAATRRRMRSRDRGYVGSAKTAGHAKGRMAHDWTVGKWR